MKELLKKDFEITVENDPTLALQRIKNEKYDIFVTDLLMPATSGEEVIKQVKKHRPNSPIFIVSCNEVNPNLNPYNLVNGIFAKPIHNVDDVIKELKSKMSIQ
jgi:DNA-binding NtrC family response regulator